MNFTPKKLIAVGAILIAATFANAQYVNPTAQTLQLGIKIDAAAFMKFTPDASISTPLGWVWTPGTTPAVSDLKLAGELVVETNLGMWDVTISSANKGYLIDGTDTLKGMTTAASPAKGKVRTILFTCADTTNAFAAAPCKVGALTLTLKTKATSVINATSDVTLSTNMAIAATIGGFRTVDMKTNTTPLTQSGNTGTDGYPYIRFPIYVGLYTDAATPGAVSAKGLLGDGDYKDTYTFTFVKGI